MPGRILNFAEFFGKYSSDGEKSLDDFTNAASNFEEGFDDETYNQNQIGPNRPVAGGTEVTPPQPGETGAPKFTSQPDAEMNAPEEEEKEEMPEEVETPEEAEEEAEEETEATETEEEEESEEDETPEPEMGANPKEDKEKVEESRLVKGFHQFISESDHAADYVYDEEWSEDRGGEDEWTEDSEDEDWKEDRFDDGDDTEIYDEHGYCEDCGEPHDEFGATCGCNM